MTHPMRDFIDMSGRVIEHLQVLHQAPSRDGKAWWWVRCSGCGHQFDERGHKLRKMARVPEWRVVCAGCGR